MCGRRVARLEQEGPAPDMPDDKRHRAQRSIDDTTAWRDSGRAAEHALAGGDTVTQTQPLELRAFDEPDEVREGNNWRLELLNLAGGAQVGRIALEPGWRWTEHVQPVAETDLCQAPHQQYQVSGRIHVVMADGAELEFGPGDVVSLPPGHDAWVVATRPLSRSTGKVRPCGLAHSRIGREVGSSDETTVRARRRQGRRGSLRAIREGAQA
jgi:quercetin dioxygenase-like cupin family protein